MIYIFLCINLIGFVLSGVDKRRAVKHQRRLSENTLLLSAFLGGSGGLLLGMLIFRHKTSKKSFLLKLVTVILLQVVFLYSFGNILGKQ